MLTKTFEHDGTTYTLRQPTIFDEEMHNSAWVDLCRAIAAERETTLENLPLTVQRLARKYIDWMQVTTIKPCPDFAKVGVYSADANAFNQWMNAILANGQALAVSWSTAHEALTKVDTDEKKEGGELSNGHQSEPLPNAVTNETD